VADVVEQSLQVGPRAPGEARQLARDVPLEPDARAKLEVIVSELVTNSVIHGAGGAAELTVRLRCEQERVTGEVCGRGSDFSWVEHEPELGEPGGLGLLIVDELAERWEIRRNGNVCVWFECAGRSAS